MFSIQDFFSLASCVFSLALRAPANTALQVTLFDSLPPELRGKRQPFTPARFRSLKLITQGSNALIVGKPGTGMSHVAKALASQATVQGYDVRYLEADSEFARYALASSQDRAHMLREWVKPDVLIVDVFFWPGESLIFKKGHSVCHGASCHQRPMKTVVGASV